jgi:type I restriction enzyme, R subunit
MDISTDMANLAGSPATRLYSAPLLRWRGRRREPDDTADELKDELDALLDEAALDEEQEKKLQQTFGRQYHLITRNDRLNEIAMDLVRHFSARGYLGKGMFIAIDKATAVRMYDKVRKVWADELAAREEQLAKAPEEARQHPHQGQGRARRRT